RLDSIQRHTELACILHVHHQTIRRYVPDRAEFIVPIGNEGLVPDFDCLWHDPLSQFSLHRLLSLGASILDALLALLSSIPSVNREYLAGNERGVVGTEPDDGAGDLFRPADAPDGMCGLQHLPYLRCSRKVAKHSGLDR